MLPTVVWINKRLTSCSIIIFYHLLTASTATTIINHETVTVDLHTSLNLKSPRYPRCCSTGTYTYLLQVGEQPGTGYIRLYFDDLDLPPGSTLQIYDGGNATARLFDDQPSYTPYSTWTRPVLASSGFQIFIIYKAGPRDYKRHIGFKIQFWSVAKGPEVWTVDRPFTDCPLVGDAMDGGELQLTTVRADPTYYQFNCIWQFKLPKLGESRTDLQLFVRLTDINIDEYGLLELFDDAYSESDELDLYRDTTTTDFSLYDQPFGGYTSEKGFCIVAKKPIDRGHIHYVYGVFSKTNPEGTECSYHLNGRSYKGYKCRKPNDWCIPKEHACNGLINCGDGSDEDPRYCKYQLVTPAPPQEVRPADDDTGAEISTTVSPDAPFCHNNECPFCTFLSLKTCPDQRCYPTEVNCPTVCDNKEEEKCSDGTCISKYYGSCPGHCSPFERRCQDNSCVNKYYRCPEDPCPTYKPYKCKTGRCYYDDERCNKYPDCFDGYDETGCLDDDAYMNWVFISLFLLVPLLCFALVCYTQSSWCKSRRQHDSCQMQNGGLRLVSMQGASAGITATTDYGSQTQDDTSHLVNSAATVAINQHLVAVATMNGHARLLDNGTDTPPPPCSTLPPTYEQAILGGARNNSPRRSQKGRLPSVSENSEVGSRRSSSNPMNTSHLSDNTAPKQGLNSNTGTMSNISTVGQDSLEPPGGLMPLSISSGGLGSIAGIPPIETLGGGLDSTSQQDGMSGMTEAESTVDQDIIQAFESNRRGRRHKRSRIRDYLLSTYYDETTTEEDTTSSDSEIYY